MPRISIWFFSVAVIYSLIGMGWGEHMAMSGDHSMYPAHAHLNLLGWVSMAIFGTFYALARDSYSPRLAWIQFALSNLGTIIMITLLARLLATNDESLGPLVGIGDILTILGQLVFGWQVIRAARAST
ncbi:MAG TPA: hypothetical protein VMS78_11880 [Rhizomicrobium sp.]|nr:hypothetical protein [Rhizomicrobium sp.]